MKKLVLGFVVLCMMIAVFTFPASSHAGVEHLFLDVGTTSVDIKKLGNLESFKEPNMAVDFRITIVNLGPFGIGAAGRAETDWNSPFDTDNIAHRGEIFARVTIWKLEVEPYLSHIGVGTQDIGWAAGARAGYGLSNAHYTPIR